MPIDAGLLGLYAITVIAMIATPGPVVVLVTGAGGIISSILALTGR